MAITLYGIKNCETFIVEEPQNKPCLALLHRFSSILHEV